MTDALEDYSDAGRKAAGEAWLKSSEWVVDAQGQARQERAALEGRVLAADGFAHVQDLTESDLLLASDYAAHEGGFAAAVATLGGQKPSLYHLDTSNPATPPRAAPSTRKSRGSCAGGRPIRHGQTG